MFESRHGPLSPSPIEELIGKPLETMTEDELREHVQTLREARSVPSKMKSLLSAEKRAQSAGEKKRAKEDKARRDAAGILKELDLGI